MAQRKYSAAANSFFLPTAARERRFDVGYAFVVLRLDSLKDLGPNQFDSKKTSIQIQAAFAL
jgi:hypothetical protein